MHVICFPFFLADDGFPSVLLQPFGLQFTFALIGMFYTIIVTQYNLGSTANGQCTCYTPTPTVPLMFSRYLSAMGTSLPVTLLKPLRMASEICSSLACSIADSFFCAPWCKTCSWMKSTAVLSSRIDQSKQSGLIGWFGRLPLSRPSLRFKPGSDQFLVLGYE